MKNYYIDENGNRFEWETPDVHAPLNSIGVMATLNVILGLWSLQDAANAAGVSPQDLINEANSWAAASQIFA